MTTLRYTAMPSDIAAAYRNGATDANGQIPERQISDGSGIPCRHCLSDIAEGEEYLVLAHRPFPNAQPYAEVGPVFLHAGNCPRHDEDAGPPPITETRESYLMRGYGSDDRIVYGTGQVVSVADMEAQAQTLLTQDNVHYVHLRSASNNCYQFRIDKA